MNSHSARNETEDILVQLAVDIMDLCIVTETWLSDDNCTVIVDLTSTGYTYHECNRSRDGICGGSVDLLCKKEYRVIENTEGETVLLNIIWGMDYSDIFFSLTECSRNIQTTLFITASLHSESNHG